MGGLDVVAAVTHHDAPCRIQVVLADRGGHDVGLGGGSPVALVVVAEDAVQQVVEALDLEQCRAMCVGLAVATSTVVPAVAQCRQGARPPRGTDGEAAMPVSAYCAR